MQLCSVLQAMSYSALSGLYSWELAQSPVDSDAFTSSRWQRTLWEERLLLLSTSDSKLWLRVAAAEVVSCFRAHNSGGSKQILAFRRNLVQKMPTVL